MSAEFGSKIPQSRVEAGRKLIGLSNFAQPGQPGLMYAEEPIRKAVGGFKDVVIDTFSRVSEDHRNSRAKRAATALEVFGIKPVFLHERKPEERASVIRDAQGFYIMGGNTGLLGVSMYARRHEDGSLVDPMASANTQPLADAYREAAAKGAPIIGESAGTMIMAHDFRTYVDDQAFPVKTSHGRYTDITGLGLLKDGLVYHPHQNDAPERDFHEMFAGDPNLQVLAANNGTFFTVSGMSMVIGGETTAVLFQHAIEPRELKPGDDVSYLLK